MGEDVTARTRLAFARKRAGFYSQQRAQGAAFELSLRHAVGCFFQHETGAFGYAKHERAQERPTEKGGLSVRIVLTGPDAHKNDYGNEHVSDPASPFGRIPELVGFVVRHVDAMDNEGTG
jgi:hypothetical protein